MSAFNPRPQSTTYPKSERQDLSQGQLGSFRFIPTDSVRSLPFHARPRQALPMSHEMAGNTREPQPSSLNSSPLASLQIQAPVFVPRYQRGQWSHNGLYSDLAQPGSIPTYDGNMSSLIRVLNSMQEAHSSLQAQLKSEQEAGIIKDSKIQHLEEHNRSLLGTVNMLKSLIQHNIKREREREEYRSTTHVEEEFRWHCLSPTKVTPKPESLSTPQAAPAGSASRCETSNVSDLISPVPCPSRNVNLVNTGVDTKRSTLGQNTNLITAVSPPGNLRVVKDLLTASEPDSFSIVLDTQQRQDCEELIEWSSEDEPIAGSTPELISRSSESKMAHASDSYWSEERSSMEHGPTLAEEQHSKSKSAGDLDNLCHALEKTQLADPSPKSHTLEVKTHATRPVATPTYQTTLMRMPYFPIIKWKITAKNPIFGSRSDDPNHEAGRTTPAVPGGSGSIFHEHPVRYTPAMSDKNLFRTVMMDFLPLGATYFDVLAQIKGGALESIRMYNHIPNVTSFGTARVVFHYERSAQEVYRRGQNPGIFIKGQRVRVWQVLEATYPKNQELSDDVFEFGCTRIILVHGIEHETALKLPSILGDFVRGSFIIEIKTTQTPRTYLVEFTGVAEAIKGMQVLARELKDAHCEFDQDPCDEPYR